MTVTTAFPDDSEERGWTSTEATTKTASNVPVVEVSVDGAEYVDVTATPVEPPLPPGPQEVAPPVDVTSAAVDSDLYRECVAFLAAVEAGAVVKVQDAKEADVMFQAAEREFRDKRLIVIRHSRLHSRWKWQRPVG